MIFAVFGYLGCIEQGKGSVVLDKGNFKIMLYNSPDMTQCSVGSTTNLAVNMSVWQDTFQKSFVYNKVGSASIELHLSCADASFADCESKIKGYVNNDQIRVTIYDPAQLSRVIYQETYKLKVISLSKSSIIGIAIGSVVGFLALCGGVWWIVVYSKKKVAYKKFQKLDAQMEY